MEQMKNMQGGDSESRAWTSSWLHGCLELRPLVFHLEACHTEGSCFFWTKHQRTRPRCQHTVICKHVPKGVVAPSLRDWTHGVWCWPWTWPMTPAWDCGKTCDTKAGQCAHARARVLAPPSAQWGLNLKQPWKRGECKYYPPGNTIHIFTSASGSHVLSLRH